MLIELMPSGRTSCSCLQLGNIVKYTHVVKCSRFWWKKPASVEIKHNGWCIAKENSCKQNECVRKPPYVSEKNMIWSLWPSMIQFNPPNHVQKTVKHLHISAGKHPFDTHPFDTSEVLQVCQLLGLKSQTSEHGAKGSVFASDLRAFDVEASSQRRGSQRSHVTNHIGVVEVEPFQLPEIFQSCDVSNHMGALEEEKFQLREILQSLDVAGDLGLGEAELRQLREILQRLNVTRDLGPSKVEELQVWQFAEARTQGAGDLPAIKQTDPHHFAEVPRWLRDPTWSKVPRKSSLLKDIYRK